MPYFQNEQKIENNTSTLRNRINSVKQCYERIVSSINNNRNAAITERNNLINTSYESLLIRADALNNANITANILQVNHSALGRISEEAERACLIARNMNNLKLAQESFEMMQDANSLQMETLEFVGFAKEAASRLSSDLEKKENPSAEEKAAVATVLRHF